MASVSYAVDVSGNQDAHQPWASFGVHLGFAKASEGEHTHDPWFVRHITDIKAAGLIPGAYHFAWPNQSAATEAANYISAVQLAAGHGFVHALDLERYPNGARNYAGLDDAQVRKYAHDWIAAVKAAFPGQKVGIYTSGDDILDGHLPGNEDFLWYPAYPVQGRTFAQAAAATRPAPSGKTVWGWQFASVPRDQTVIYTSPAVLRTWAAGTPQEDPMPTADEIAKAVWTYPLASPTAAEGTNPNRSAGTFLRYDDARHADVVKRLAAQDAAITTLVAHLGQDVDTAQVVAAVQQAIAAAVVHVQVDVTGRPAA